MGRPPLKIATKTVKTSVRMDQDTHARVVALVGEQKMAEFIRDAVERELKRRERAQSRPDHPEKEG